MFPFEIITMLGSTLISSLLSLWSQRMKAKQDEQKMLLQRAEIRMEAVDAARNVENVNVKVPRIKLDEVECIACEG